MQPKTGPQAAADSRCWVFRLTVRRNTSFCVPSAAECTCCSSRPPPMVASGSSCALQAQGASSHVRPDTTAGSWLSLRARANLLCGGALQRCFAGVLSIGPNTQASALMCRAVLVAKCSCRSSECLCVAVASSQGHCRPHEPHMRKMAHAWLPGGRLVAQRQRLILALLAPAGSCNAARPHLGSQGSSLPASRSELAAPATGPQEARMMHLAA